MRLLGILLIFIVTIASAQTEYVVEDIDLFDDYNNSYRKQGDYFVQNIIDGLKSGDFSCYQQGLFLKDTLSKKAFFESLLMREMTYGMDYFYPSDITLLKLVSKTERAKVSSTHLELYISAEHPDNLMGSDRFVGAFLLSDLQEILAKRVWHRPDNNGDSLSFTDALRVDNHGYRSKYRAFYSENGTRLEHYSGDLWLDTWDNMAEAWDSMYFRYEITESMKWKGVVTGVEALPAWLMEKVQNGELEGFERNWNGGPNRSLSFDDMHASLLIEQARIQNKEAIDSWDEEFGAPPIPQEEFFGWDQLSFSIVSDVVYKDGDLLRIPKMVNVVVPYCAKNNVKGIDLSVASFMYKDIKILSEQPTINGVFREWQLPILEPFGKGVYYPSSFWLLDIYGNEVVACDADGKGNIDIYGARIGFMGANLELNKDSLSLYRNQDVATRHMWRLKDLLLRRDSYAEHSFIKNNILKMPVQFELKLHQGITDPFSIKLMERIMKNHPNGHKTESTDEWFNFDDYTALDYLDSLETKWNVCYQYTFQNEEMTIEPVAVYWYRGDGLEWFSIEGLKEQLGERRFKKLQLNFKKNLPYIGINNHGTAIVWSGKPAHEKMPYHSYVLKFVESLEE